MDQGPERGSELDMSGLLRLATTHTICTSVLRVGRCSYLVKTFSLDARIRGYCSFDVSHRQEQDDMFSI